MRSRHALAAAATIVGSATLLTGCADPSLRDDAERLRDDVRGLPGVASVELEYTAPVTLDSGKLRLAVRIERGASPDEVADVGATVFEALSTTHRREEGDVDVTLGGSNLHLRSFEPEAEGDVVAGEWRLAAELAATYDVALDVMTQDVENGDHVRTQVEVTLGDGTGEGDVRSTLEELEAAYGADEAQRGWGVAAADGAGVHRDAGFPTSSTLSS